MLATEPEIRIELGSRVTQLRLEKNLSQSQLALRAGIGVATLQRFEQGNGATLTTFIQVLMALGHLDDLNLILAPPQLSIKALEAQWRLKNRVRASRKNEKEQNAIFRRGSK